MKGLEISKELKNDIETNQKMLQKAIRNHQNLFLQVKLDPECVEAHKELDDAEKEIILIGIAQKNLLERLRDEYKCHEKCVKKKVVKTKAVERRARLNNTVGRARKQKIISRPTSVSASSASDESVETNSGDSSPEQIYNPVCPHDLEQAEFYFQLGLVTHDIHKEMQNKRAERKRRSTAHPSFVYGNKEWECQPTRRKKATVSSISPPNNRQAGRKKIEVISPPSVVNGATPRSAFTSFPAIPNLPSGLTIERVSPTGSSPDTKYCNICKTTGLLSICESCANGFHVSCHNRPLTQPPRQCPRCITKEVRTIGSLNVPSGMSVSYVTPSEVSEKIEEKEKLEMVNKSLSAELTQLQDRHSQLTISLKNQKTQQEELLMTQQTTEGKIKQILTFISNVKKGGKKEPAQA